MNPRQKKTYGTIFPTPFLCCSTDFWLQANLFETEPLWFKETKLERTMLASLPQEGDMNNPC